MKGEQIHYKSPNNLRVTNNKFSSRTLLFLLFPVVGYVVQKYNPFYTLLPNDFYFKHLLINKMPAFSMILYAILIAILPDKSTILRRLPSATYFLLPLLIVFLIKLDKSILIYGAADKPILYGNKVYTTISIMIYFLWVKKVNFLTEISKILRFLFLPLALLISGYIASFTVFDLRHPYNGNYLNWMVVLNPIIQSAYGKTIFVDQYSQYGGYGIFFKPIFMVISPTLFNITLILSILLAICLISIFYISYRIFDNYLFAFIVSISTIYLGIYAFSLWPGEKYFQVTPIRIIFPILASLLVLVSSKIQIILRIFIFSATSTLAMFWNLETGLVVLIALLCQVIYISEGIRKILIYTGIYSSSCFFFILLFIEVLQFSSNKSFSLEIFVRPLLLYGAGGELLFNKTWVIVFFVYGLGLILGWRGRKQKIKEYAYLDFLFFISVLSLGLLLYHLLRENQHDATLTPNIWSFPIILGTILSISMPNRIFTMKVMKIQNGVKKLKQAQFLHNRSVDESRRPVLKSSVNFKLSFFKKIDRIFLETLWSIGFIFLIFTAFCFIGIQKSTPVTSEIRFWELGNMNSQKALYKTKLDESGQYVTISEQAKGFKSPWQVRSDFAETTQKNQVSHDLLILSEFDALMYISAKSSTPATWANWRHSGLVSLQESGKVEFEHDVTLLKFQSGEINRVIIDEYVGNMQPPFAVHPACNNCDEKLLDYIKKNFNLVKTSNGGLIYNYYLASGPDWSDSTLTYWIRRP